MICTTIDITEKKQAENYENFRSNVLEQLNKEKPLITILDCIVREVEHHYPAMLCSIMLLDNSGSHFGIGVAPSLPGFYNKALEGMSIGVGERNL